MSQNISIVTSQCNQSKHILQDDVALVKNNKSTTVVNTVVGDLSYSNNVIKNIIVIDEPTVNSILCEPCKVSLITEFVKSISKNILPTSSVVKQGYIFKSGIIQETNVISYHDDKIILYNDGCSVVLNKNNKFDSIHEYSTITTVFNKPINKVTVEETTVMCNLLFDKSSKVGLIVEPITVLVDDYKPPFIGNSGSGEGIKFIRLSAQKYSYTEIFLDFTERKVVDVTGLPDGLHLESGIIKGSAKLSGKYPLNIVLDNNSSLDALLIVPELPRLI